MRIVPFVLLLGACWAENLPQVNVNGTVVLPRAAATYEVPLLNDVGEVIGSEERTDTRFIGPVFLGAFSGIDTDTFRYPHPSMGPVLGEDAGDTFPYGGTTVGRFDFACYEALSCRVVTGRFSGYADLLDYFEGQLGNPVTDQYGNEVVEPSTFQQYCFDYFYATSDDEFSFLGPEDFQENDNGDFEASFTLAQTTLVPGMAVWGYMDAPVILADNPQANGGFTTCDSETGGRNSTEYDRDFYEGAPYYDVLNLPQSYITFGDWVGDGTTFVETAEDSPVVSLGVQYTEGE